MKEGEKAKLLVNKISNVTTYNNTYVSIQEELINDIIASINRIKNNISSNVNESRLNEAIIIKYPEGGDNEYAFENKTDNISKNNNNITTSVVSGIEDKLDVQVKNVTSMAKNKGTTLNVEKIKDQSITNKTNYVEILTVEPNTTNNNSTSPHNIIEVLKHLMPILNGSNHNELHSVTIIERNQSKNHSVSETKNISTLVVKYCDKGNLTAESLTKDVDNQTPSINTTDVTDTSDDYVDANKELPIVDRGTVDEDYSDKDGSDYDDKHVESANSTVDENKDVLEAAEYGMRKMHELYSVLEPKLYSMGKFIHDVDKS